MSELRAPEWLLKENGGTSPKGGGAFLRKSALVLSRTIRSVRRTPERPRGLAFSPAARLALALVAILLVSASRRFLFVETIGVALLALLATYDARKLARTLTLPFEAFLASLVLLAPALFWGQTRAVVVVPAKTFVTTLILSTLAQSMNWNRLTCAFKTFGAPDALVFIFDLTLKYVVVFGEVCLETIDAALLRSVGRDRRGARTLGGIVGSVFLRAQVAAQEQFDAMTCRCFSGVYRRYRAPFRRADLIAVLLIVVLIALFIYFELQAHV